MGGRHGLIHNEKVASYKLSQHRQDFLKSRLTTAPLTHKQKVDNLPFFVSRNTPRKNESQYFQ